VRRGRRAGNVDEQIVEEYTRITGLFAQPLPIRFYRRGETLTGELHLVCQANLREVARNEAERNIELLMKQALQANPKL
jgi:hypothetical protein